MTTITTPAEQYGHCLNCEATFPDRAAMNAHLSATMPKGGGSSHRCRVDNPTEAEQRQSRARAAVTSAIDSAIEQLDRQVGRDGVAAEEIAEALSGRDLADEWDEYMRENAPEPEPESEPSGSRPITGDTPFNLEGLAS